jgi:hypothetical protein
MCFIFKSLYNKAGPFADQPCNCTLVPAVFSGINIIVMTIKMVISLLAIAACIPAHGQADNLESTTIGCWRKVLSTQLGIRADRFLLYPGSAPVGASSTWLWNLFDALTTNITGYYLNPAQYNSFSADYGLILYQSMVSDSSPNNCNLNDAIVKYHNANGQYRWNKTIEDLTKELKASKPLNIRFDTTIYVPPGDSMVIKITATFKHILVFSSYPYDEKAAAATGYPPWYMRCVLEEAYNNKESRFWEPAFGPNGFLQFISTAVIVADSASIFMSGSSNTLSFSTSSEIKQPVVQGMVVINVRDYLQSINYSTTNHENEIQKR